MVTYNDDGILVSRKELIALIDAGVDDYSAIVDGIHSIVDKAASSAKRVVAFNHALTPVQLDRITKAASGNVIQIDRDHPSSVIVTPRALSAAQYQAIRDILKEPVGSFIIGDSEAVPVHQGGDDTPALINHLHIYSPLSDDDVSRISPVLSVSSSEVHYHRTPILTPEEHQAISTLVNFVRLTVDALEDGSEDIDIKGNDIQDPMVGVLVDHPHVDLIGKALDQINELPDAPGYICGPAAKIEYALRRFWNTADRLNGTYPQYVQDKLNFLDSHANDYMRRWPSQSAEDFNRAQIIGRSLLDLKGFIEALAAAPNPNIVVTQDPLAMLTNPLVQARNAYPDHLTSATTFAVEALMQASVTQFRGGAGQRRAAIQTLIENVHAQASASSPPPTVSSHATGTCPDRETVTLSVAFLDSVARHFESRASNSHEDMVVQAMSQNARNARKAAGVLMDVETAMTGLRDSSAPFAQFWEALRGGLPEGVEHIVVAHSTPWVDGRYLYAHQFNALHAAYLFTSGGTVEPMPDAHAARASAPADVAKKPEGYDQGSEFKLT